MSNAISNEFLECDIDFAALKYPPQTSELSPIEQLWDAVEQEIHNTGVKKKGLQHLCDTIVSILAKLSG